MRKLILKNILIYLLIKCLDDKIKIIIFVVFLVFLIFFNLNLISINHK